MKSRFRVAGRFDMARVQEAKVEIDRNSMTFSVRPLRRRRAYTLPLATVAEIVCARIIKAEVAERRSATRRNRTRA